MEAMVFLADSAQGDASGKVHALGIGWSATSTPTPPAALVVLVKIPWDQTNTRHELTITLVDADGQPVALVVDPEGGEPGPLTITAEFEVGRPPGLPPGTPIDNSLAVNLAPGMPLTSGQAYEWRMEIDGEHKENWSARFAVR